MLPEPVFRYFRQGARDGCPPPRRPPPGTLPVPAARAPRRDRGRRHHVPARRPACARRSGSRRPRCSGRRIPRARWRRPAPPRRGRADGALEQRRHDVRGRRRHRGGLVAPGLRHRRPSGLPAAARARGRGRAPGGGAHRGHPGGGHQVRRRAERLGADRPGLAAGQLRRRLRRPRPGTRRRPTSARRTSTGWRAHRPAGGGQGGARARRRAPVRRRRRRGGLGLQPRGTSARPGRCHGRLPRRVVAEIGDDAEVYVDGGVRTGRHALVALALGARAAFLGRPPLYALAADGATGVERLLADARPRSSWLPAAPPPPTCCSERCPKASAASWRRRPRTAKPPLTCANADVTGRHATPICSPSPG